MWEKPKGHDSKGCAVQITLETVATKPNDYTNDAIMKEAKGPPNTNLDEFEFGLEVAESRRRRATSGPTIIEAQKEGIQLVQVEMKVVSSPKNGVTAGLGDQARLSPMSVIN